MDDPSGMIKPRPDAELVEGVRRGNMRAFAALMDRYRDRSYALAVRMLGDPSSAEEAVQDAFLKAYRGIAGFRGEAAFGTWFYRIVYNCCLTRARRTVPDRIPLEEAENEGPASDEPGAEELMEIRELAALVNEVIDGLPSHLRSVVTLFYLEEMRYEEIAEILEVPLGTVKTHLFRARARIKRRVRERLGVEEDRT